MQNYSKLKTYLAVLGLKDVDIGWVKLFPALLQALKKIEKVIRTIVDPLTRLASVCATAFYYYNMEKIAEKVHWIQGPPEISYTGVCDMPCYILISTFHFINKGFIWIKL